jgi:NADPH:quinone reductase-like Zn-dependent oxidoreductase
VKAWVKRDGELRLCDVPDPVPGADELLIRVGAVSLNRGEIRTVARAAEGTIPGWDVAGTVVATPLNRNAPGEGARVAALLRGGGWAELATVPVSQAALVPDEVELEVAATLPIAALTVVRALDVAGRVLGKRLLITGGSGGVGQFAIQLGAIAGAHVCAVSSRQSEHEHLKGLGAAEIVASIDDAGGHFDLVLESVGGPSLAKAVDLVARGGVVVTIGNSSERDTTLNARDIYSKGAARIYGLLIFEEMESGRIGARDLEQLLDLVRTGRLRAPVAVRRSWTELPETVNDLERRVFAGKAVLQVA